MNARFEVLQSQFRQLGVVTLAPGFYDDPAFMEAERLVPTLLDVYAEYCVVAASMEDQTKNEEKILRVLSFLAPLITAQGEDGKCMPTTLLLQRFLDAEGVWNFPQKGGVVVAFPTETALPAKAFEPTDKSQGTYGHAWTVAPPFVIDLTIARQFYSPEQQEHVVGFVLAKETLAATESPFVDPPNASIQEKFPPFSVSLGQCTISYFPYGTGGPTESFSELAQPILDGLRPFALFERYRVLERERLTLAGR